MFTRKVDILNERFEAVCIITDGHRQNKPNSVMWPGKQPYGLTLWPSRQLPLWSTNTSSQRRLVTTVTCTVVAVYVYDNKFNHFNLPSQQNMYICIWRT